MSRRRSKPTDPATIQQRRADRLANEGEIKRLRDAGAVVNLDRARLILSAYRANVFRKLLEARTISQAQAGAAERLCEDWAAWKGLDGKPAPLPIPSGPGGTAECVTDRMIKAGDRVRAALEAVGPMDRELLIALVMAAVEEDRAMNWREIVQRVTGVLQTVRQSQMIVAALENLARVYGEPRVYLAGRRRARAMASAS